LISSEATNQRLEANLKVVKKALEVMNNPKGSVDLPDEIIQESSMFETVNKNLVDRLFSPTKTESYFNDKMP